MNLTITEALFITEYIKNGGDGTKAYLSIKPDVKRSSAAVSACRLLKRVTVAVTIGTIISDSIATREKLIEEAMKIMEKAEEAGDYDSALKAINVIAKMAGYYNENWCD